MALTKEFVEAVSQGNLLRVRIMLKDSLLVDTSFNQFNEMLSYAEPRLSGIWVIDDEDDDVFSQSPEELNTILAGLVNNFSKRRVTHLKGMINKLYSSQPKPNQQYRREAVVVIKKTREVVNEYNGIVMDRKKMKEVCARISQNKQMDTKDIELIRTAAISIVNHCDKITRK